MKSVKSNGSATPSEPPQARTWTGAGPGDGAASDGKNAARSAGFFSEWWSGGSRAAPTSNSTAKPMAPSTASDAGSQNRASADAEHSSGPAAPATQTAGNAYYNPLSPLMPGAGATGGNRQVTVPSPHSIPAVDPAGAVQTPARNVPVRLKDTANAAGVGSGTKYSASPASVNSKPVSSGNGSSNSADSADSPALSLNPYQSYDDLQYPYGDADGDDEDNTAAAVQVQSQSSPTLLGQGTGQAAAAAALFGPNRSAAHSARDTKSAIGNDQKHTPPKNGAEAPKAPAAVDRSKSESQHRIAAELARAARMVARDNFPLHTQPLDGIGAAIANVKNLNKSQLVLTKLSVDKFLKLNPQLFRPELLNEIAPYGIFFGPEKAGKSATVTSVLGRPLSLSQVGVATVAPCAFTCVTDEKVALKPEALANGSAVVDRVDVTLDAGDPTCEVKRDVLPSEAASLVASEMRKISASGNRIRCDAIDLAVRTSQQMLPTQCIDLPGIPGKDSEMGEVFKEMAPQLTRDYLTQRVRPENASSWGLFVIKQGTHLQNLSVSNVLPGKFGTWPRTAYVFTNWDELTANGILERMRQRQEPMGDELLMDVLTSGLYSSNKNVTAFFVCNPGSQINAAFKEGNPAAYATAVSAIEAEHMCAPKSLTAKFLKTLNDVRDDPEFVHKDQDLWHRLKTEMIGIHNVRRLVFNLTVDGAKKELEAVAEFFKLLVKECETITSEEYQKLVELGPTGESPVARIKAAVLSARCLFQHTVKGDQIGKLAPAFNCVLPSAEAWKAVRKARGRSLTQDTPVHPSFPPHLEPAVENFILETADPKNERLASALLRLHKFIGTFAVRSCLATIGYVERGDIAAALQCDANGVVDMSAALEDMVRLHLKETFEEAAAEYVKKGVRGIMDDAIETTMMGLETVPRYAEMFRGAVETPHLCAKLRADVTEFLRAEFSAKAASDAAEVIRSCARQFQSPVLASVLNFAVESLGSLPKMDHEERRLYALRRDLKPAYDRAVADSKRFDSKTEPTPLRREPDPDEDKEDVGVIHWDVSAAVASAPADQKRRLAQQHNAVGASVQLQTKPRMPYVRSDQSERARLLAAAKAPVSSADELTDDNNPKAVEYSRDRLERMCLTTPQIKMKLFKKLWNVFDTPVKLFALGQLKSLSAMNNEDIAAFNMALAYRSRLIANQFAAVIPYSLADTFAPYTRAAFLGGEEEFTSRLWAFLFARRYVSHVPAAAGAGAGASTGASAGASVRSGGAARSREPLPAPGQPISAPVPVRDEKSGSAGAVAARATDAPVPDDATIKEFLVREYALQSPADAIRARHQRALTVLHTIDPLVDSLERFHFLLKAGVTDA